MTSRPEPYIGITGFKRREQAEALLDVAFGQRTLMVGVLASYRSLILGETKPDGRSPRAQDIADIFPRHRTLNLIHYFTEDQHELAMQLDRAMYFGGRHCDGLQLNINWPSSEVLKGFRRSWPNKFLVLQVGNRNHPLVLEGEPAFIAARIVLRYAGLIDYVLLDASAGLGKELSTDVMARYLEPLTRCIEEERLPIGVTVAGGLHAENLHLVQELASRFPGLSFDAEGKLHSGPGHLDMAACRAYLLAGTWVPK